MSEKGFTLIELLVVIAIIGVLAAIAIPQFAEYRIASFNASALATLKNSVTAQEAVFVDTGAYVTCTSSANCELLLPSFRIATTGGTYSVDPLRHEAVPDGSSFEAFASHISGDKNYNYSSITGTFSY